MGRAGATQWWAGVPVLVGIVIAGSLAQATPSATSERPSVLAAVSAALPPGLGPLDVPHRSLEAAVAAFDARLGVERAPGDLSALDALDPDLSNALAHLLSALLVAAEARDAAFEGIDDAEILQFLGSESNPDASDLALRVDRALMARAGLTVARAVDDALPVLASLQARLPALQSFTTAPPLVNLPPVLVADPLGVANTYGKDAVLAVDLGGDDLYDMNAGGSIIGIGPSADPTTCQFNLLGVVAVGCEFEDAVVSITASLAIDVAGNDAYGVRKSPHGADDVCTNDPIIRRIVMQGAGSGGIGMLVDVAGDDKYDAKTLSQGHGHISGLGVLVELGGNDEYRAVRSSQGSGVLGGTGVFLDAGGNDFHAFASPAGGIFNVDAGTCDATARLGLGFGTLASTGHYEDADGMDTYSIQSQAFGAGSLGAGTFHDDGADNDNYNGFPGRNNNQVTPSSSGLFADR